MEGTLDPLGVPSDSMEDFDPEALATILNEQYLGGGGSIGGGPGGGGPGGGGSIEEESRRIGGLVEKVPAKVDQVLVSSSIREASILSNLPTMGRPPHD